LDRSRARLHNGLYNAEATSSYPPTNRLEPGLRIESPLGPKSPKELAIPPASFFPFSGEVP